MKNWIAAGAVLGFLGVAIGAFGAHSLKPHIQPDLLDTYKTGVLYHLIHAVVILAIGLSGRQHLAFAAWFIFAGVVLFSFSLYIYSVTAIRFLAMITPFGGFSFLIGWLLIGFSAIKYKQE